MGIRGELAQLLDAEPQRGRLLRGGPPGREVGLGVVQQLVGLAERGIEHGGLGAERAGRGLAAHLFERAVAPAVGVGVVLGREALVDPGQPVVDAPDEAQRARLRRRDLRRGLLDVAEHADQLGRELGRGDCGRAALDVVAVAVVGVRRGGARRSRRPRRAGRSGACASEDQGPAADEQHVVGRGARHRRASARPSGRAAACRGWGA